MAQVDFGLLRRRIANATRQTFDAVREAHSGESFYVFALYSVEDAVIVNPSTNSEEVYQSAVARQMANDRYKKRLESLGISLSAALLGDQRWSAHEWKYECAESDGFDAVNDLINNRGLGFHDKDDPLGFVKFKAGVFASMVMALSDLNKQGYFGNGVARESLTVFCSVPNSWCTVWLEEDSARRLNPPRVFQKFAEERIKWIATGAEKRNPAPDSVHGVYLSLLQQE